MDSDKLQATTYMSRNFYLLAIGIYLPAKKKVFCRPNQIPVKGSACTDHT